MSKLALPLLGVGGVGVSCGGGYLLLKDRESSDVRTKQEGRNPREEQEELGKRKYPEDTYGYYYGGVILDTESDSDLGGYRFSDLGKANSDPLEDRSPNPNIKEKFRIDSSKGGTILRHPKLTEAISKYSSDEQKARALHKEACREIFNESFGLKGLWTGDVERYCSKKIRDEFGGNGTWENRDKNGWNKRIKGLLNRDFKDFTHLDDGHFKTAWLKVKEDQEVPGREVAGLNEKCHYMGDEPFSRLNDSGAMKVKWMKDVCSEPEVSS